MKIAMIGQKGLPARDGGVERHVHDLSVRLVSLGYEVKAYSRPWYTGGGTTTLKGVSIVHLPTLHTKHFDAISHSLVSTLHAMYKSKVDIIHYHGVGPSLVSWIPRLLTPHIKIVTTFHSMDRKHEKWGKIAKFILKLGEYTACKFANTLIAVSPTIEQYTRDVYDKKAKYIPNGVEIQEKSPSDALLQEWDLNKQNYLIMVSRLIPHKGAHYLVDAWKELKKEKAELLKDKKLVIVGDGYYTDTYVKNLKERAKTESSIIFTGFQNGEKLKTLFSHALLQVHPSDNEGLPICVLEGMSYGLPVLLSNIPEHRDLNNDNDSLFQYGSVNSLKQKLIEFLSLHPEQIKMKGTVNKSIIERYYTWEKIVENMNDIYSTEPTLALEKTVASV